MVSSDSGFRGQSRKCYGLCVLFIAAGLVCIVASGCKRQMASPKPVAADDRDLDRELKMLRLADECASAADRYWRRGDYRESATKFVLIDFSYSSHYNARMKRCLVAIYSRSVFISGGANLITDVFDALDSGTLSNPIATMTEFATDVSFNDGRVTQIVKAGKDVDVTVDEISWFRDLMTK